LENKKNDIYIAKLDSIIINQLSLENINQLKYIYQMSDEANLGYVTI
jgi:hypothetical protein